MPQTIDNMIATWNNSGTTFTAVKMNVTDTASASGSLLMDLGTGGASFSSKFTIAKDGKLTTPWGSIQSQSGDMFINNQNNNYVYLGVGGTVRLGVSKFNGVVLFNETLGWSTGGGSNTDLFLARRAAANLRLGAADAATAVAQTLSVQSVVAGTTNTAGANLTITGSQGTGTGAGGSIVFQVAPAGSSGTAQNALADALIIQTGARLKMRSGSVAGNAGSGLFSLDNTAIAFGQDAGGGVWGGITPSGFTVDAAAYYSFGSSGTAAPDTILRRDTANTLALRNGTNAQTFRVYNTTDGTNSEFGKIAWSSNVLQIGTEKAGTGTARALEFQTDGVTRLSISDTGVPNFTSGTVNFGNLSARLFTSVGSYISFEINNGNPIPYGYRDALFFRDAAGVTGVRGANSTTGGALSFIEQTAPAAPAANGVRIYAEDNGSGKTRLMALFATGVAQQIAIEP